MHREVVLTADAERDLEELITYIAEHDSLENAQRVLDRLLKASEGLSSSAQRGSIPKELLSLGIQEYRQVFFKPYRIIYRLVEQQVVVYLIADGRREMQALLSRRMLGA